MYVAVRLCAERECDGLVKQMTEANLEAKRKIKAMEALLQVIGWCLVLTAHGSVCSMTTHTPPTVYPPPCNYTAPSASNMIDMLCHWCRKVTARADSGRLTWRE